MRRASTAALRRASAPGRRCCPIAADRRRDPALSAAGGTRATCAREAANARFLAEACAARRPASHARAGRRRPGDRRSLLRSRAAWLDSPRPGPASASSSTLASGAVAMSATRSAPRRRRSSPWARSIADAPSLASGTSVARTGAPPANDRPCRPAATMRALSPPARPVPNANGAKIARSAPRRRSSGRRSVRAGGTASWVRFASFGATRCANR